MPPSGFDPTAHQAAHFVNGTRRYLVAPRVEQAQVERQAKQKTQLLKPQVGLAQKLLPTFVGGVKFSAPGGLAVQIPQER